MKYIEFTKDDGKRIRVAQDHISMIRENDNGVTINVSGENIRLENIEYDVATKAIKTLTDTLSLIVGGHNPC